MKKILAFATAALFCLNSTALAVELEQATNQQILNELSKRLSGTPSQPDSSYAVFACDNNYYLMISLTGPSGDETVQKLYLGSACSNVSKKLSSRFSEITKTTVVAVCDNNYYLNKFSLLPSGVIKATSKTYLGSDCQTQADQINK